MNELVVALYNENTDWLTELRDYKITVYNKGGNEIKDSIKLPNVGREAHTYFYHIVNNYNDLADYTFFSQGNPHDHVKNFKWILETLPDSLKEAKLMTGSDGYFFSNGHHTSTLESQSNGEPHHVELLDIDGLWSELFTSRPLGRYTFTAGAIFCVSRDQIKTKDKLFYEKCLKLSVDREQAPWEFERIVPYIFNPDTK